MRSLRALRALARIELRQLSRHPGRSVLVILLITIPVAALVGGSTLYRITHPTAEESRAEVMGSADLRIETDHTHDADRILALLPGTARVEHLLVGDAEVRVPGRRLLGRSFVIEPGGISADGLARGHLRTTTGRTPDRSGEVALSPLMLEGLDRTIGERVTLDSAEATIVGVVQSPENIGLPVVLRAGSLSAEVEQAHHESLLVELPETDADPTLTRLRDAGIRVRARGEIGTSDGFETVAMFVLAGFGFFLAALVIAAAFAVSLRRRQREIGLLGATGASVGVVRASMLLSALVLASIGCVLGTACGLGTAAALLPFWEDWNGRWNGGFEISYEHLAGALLLGLATAVIAAVLPATSSTRLPVRAALGGRRPVTTGARTWFIAGVVLLVGGFGFMFWGSTSTGFVAGTGVLIGAVLGVLGFGACSPSFLHGLARLAAPLPLAWRLAVRDAGRFRSRNGPVVTSVLAGMSIPVLIGTMVASLDFSLDLFPPRLGDDQLLVEGPAAEEVARIVSGEFAGTLSAPLAAVHARGEPVVARFVPQGNGGRTGPTVIRGGWIACGGEDLLRILGVEHGAGEFRQGRLISLVDPERAGGSSLELRSEQDGRVLGRLDAVPIEPTRRLAGPAFVLSQQAALPLEWTPGPPPGKGLTPWLLRLDGPITAATHARAREIAARFAGTTVDAERLRLRPTFLFVQVAFWICLATGLMIVFVATALSAAESAADARMLHIVGAAPHLLRRHLAASAGYLAFLGCVLAVPAGLIPFFGLRALAHAPLEFSMPWSVVSLTVIALPALAYGGTWLFALLRGGSPATSRCDDALVPFTNP